MSSTNPAFESGDIVRLGDEKQAIEVLAQSILGLWEVVNNLTRLRPTRREEAIALVRQHHERWSSGSTVARGQEGRRGRRLPG